jgi:O-antigen ligase
MTTLTVNRSPAPPETGSDRRPLLVTVAIVVFAVILGTVVSAAPVLALAVVVGALAAAYLARHPLAATGLLIASFYFDEILSTGGLVTPGKLIGVVAATAWLVDTIRNGRPVRTVPHLWPLALLTVWLIPSLTVVEDTELGLVFASRYVMFVMLFFLVVQAVDGQYRRALFLTDCTVAGAAVAAAIGLAGFLWGGDIRAGGPVGDPNDFGFLLASAAPLSLWRRGTWEGTWRWNPFTVTTLVIVAATLATFSRGALVALAVAVAWSVATRRVPLRQGLAAAAVVLVVAAVGFFSRPDLVNQSLELKAVVAERNVDVRVDAWAVAVDEFASAPITGVGPGQFVVRYTDFAPPPADGGEGITTHNAYLNILAELGLPGLLAFVGYLVVAWRSLRRPESDSIVDGFRGALAASFLVALVGALFLTEQFFAPLWLFGALGASELRGQPARERARARAVRALPEGDRRSGQRRSAVT